MQRSVLFVSGKEVKGDLGVFATSYGYSHYYGAIPPSDVTPDLLVRIPGVDIFWMMVDDVGMPVELEKYEAEGYGDRQMFIVKPRDLLGSVTRSVLQHGILPALSGRDLAALSSVAKSYRNVADLKAMYSAAKALGDEELSIEEFRGLGPPGQAYAIWEKYLNVMKLIRTLKREIIEDKKHPREQAFELSRRWPKEPFVNRLSSSLLLRLITNLYSTEYTTMMLIPSDIGKLLFRRLVSLSTDSDLLLLLESRGHKEGYDVTMELVDPEEEREWKAQFSDELIPDIGQALLLIYNIIIGPLFEAIIEENRVDVVKSVPLIEYASATIPGMIVRYATKGEPPNEAFQFVLQHLRVVRSLRGKDASNPRVRAWIEQYVPPSLR